jgi:4-hydroxyphenylacetate 3-monooxygenase
VRTGAEYLESLKDGREVWLNGERVDDVTTHPVLCRTAQAIARLYDLQHDPTFADIVTFLEPSEGRQKLRFSGVLKTPDCARR